MKKHIFMILSAMVLALGFTSCIDEEGPGTPSLKKMHLQTTEYNIDFRGVQFTDETWAEELAKVITLRWIDVTNATYQLSFTNDRADASTQEVKKVLDNKQVPGDLSTLSADFTYAQLIEYIDEQGIWEDVMETQKDDKGNDITVEFQRAIVNMNVTGTPIDKTNTALAPEGSTATAVVTIYRDKQ